MGTMGRAYHRRRRSGYLVYYDRPSNSTPFRSLVRYARRLDRTHVSSSLMAVLVGFALTMICQGHFVDGRFTGPHLMILGGSMHHDAFAHQDFPEDGTWDPAQPDGIGIDDPATLDHHSHAGVYPQTQAFTSTTPTTPTGNSIGANSAKAALNPLVESGSSVALSYLITLLLLGFALSLRRGEIGETNQHRSQVNSPPDPPPPRPYSTGALVLAP